MPIAQATRGRPGEGWVKRMIITPNPLARSAPTATSAHGMMSWLEGGQDGGGIIITNKDNHDPNPYPWNQPSSSSSSSSNSSGSSRGRIPRAKLQVQSAHFAKCSFSKVIPKCSFPKVLISQSAYSKVPISQSAHFPKCLFAKCPF